MSQKVEPGLRLWSCPRLGQGILCQAPKRAVVKPQSPARARNLCDNILRFGRRKSNGESDPTRPIRIQTPMFREVLRELLSPDWKKGVLPSLMAYLLLVQTNHPYQQILDNYTIGLLAHQLLFYTLAGGSLLIDVATFELRLVAYCAFWYFWSAFCLSLRGNHPRVSFALITAPFFLNMLLVYIFFSIAPISRMAR